MDQTFYILDVAIDRLNITFVHTSNCFSDTERHCGKLPLSTVHTNQKEPRKATTGYLSW